MEKTRKIIIFQDYHVLHLLGFKFKKIKNGYSKRTTVNGCKLIHPNTLRNFLSSLGYKETIGLLVKVIRKLFQPGLIRGQNFCTDTKIIFKDSPNYAFAKKVYDYKGKLKNCRLSFKMAIYVQNSGIKIVLRPTSLRQVR